MKGGFGGTSRFRSRPQERPEWGRTSRFHRGPANGRNRRICVIRTRAGKWLKLPPKQTSLIPLIHFGRVVAALVHIDRWRQLIGDRRRNQIVEPQSDRRDCQPGMCVMRVIEMPIGTTLSSPRPTAYESASTARVRSTQVEMEQRLFLFNWPIRPGPVVDSPYQEPCVDTL